MTKKFAYGIIDMPSWSILTCLTPNPKRYKDLKQSTHLADSVLSNRLNMLQELGIIKSKPVTGDRYFVYTLTARGKRCHRAFKPIIQKLKAITVTLKSNSNV